MSEEIYDAKSETFDYIFYFRCIISFFSHVIAIYGT